MGINNLDEGILERLESIQDELLVTKACLFMLFEREFGFPAKIKIEKKIFPSKEFSAENSQTILSEQK